MPARTRAAGGRQARQAPEPEPDETAGLNGEKDYSVYADKPITPTMEAFHEWLEDVTGIELDERSVALGGSLRMDFQRSDFWADDSRNRKNRVAEEEEEDEAPAPRRSGRSKPAPAAATPTKRRGRRAEPEPPEDEDIEDEQDDDIEESEEEPEAEPTPAPRRARSSGRTAKAAVETDGKPAAPRSGRRRGGRAATAPEGAGTATPY